MNRLQTMARFDEPTDQEPIAYCLSCDEDLAVGTEAICFDNDFFCNEECFITWSGIEKIIIGE